MLAELVEAEHASGGLTFAVHAVGTKAIAYGIPGARANRCPGRAPHDARYDATACALLLSHFLALPGWEQVTVQGLADLK